MKKDFLLFSILLFALPACNNGPKETPFTPPSIKEAGATTLRLNYVGDAGKKISWKVDGKPAGQNKRAAVSLSRSKHQLMVTVDEKSQQYWLDAATDLPLFVEIADQNGMPVSSLAAGSEVGETIYIKSDPQGANVFINRRLFGNTPVAVGLVGAGQQMEIILTRPGFRNTKVDFTVKKGQLNQVVIPMEPLAENESPLSGALPRPKTTLSIDAPDSPGSKILLNGIDINRVTPQENIELPIGAYQVTLVRADGSSFYFNTELEEGKPTVIKENIKDLQAKDSVRPGSIIPSAKTEGPAEGDEEHQHGHRHHN